MVIRDLRRRAGLSQAGLGAMVGLGQSNISRIESRKQKVTVDVLHRMAQALSVPVTDLIENERDRRA
jgi:transcriptional regulator with XRE-family HTH domain